MTYTFIEINDISLRVWKDGSLVCESPGLAHVNGSTLLFGDQALARSRSEPQGLLAQHWSNIDVVPLSRPNKVARHHADLVYRHLEYLRKQHGPLENVIFIVPSEISHEQLGLLLGIAKSLKVSVAGLVDSALANVASLEVRYPEIQYVELGLFRTTISNIQLDGHLRFHSVQTLARSGKDYLTSLGMNLVADCFLDQARFDPLEQAQTEQIIFDQLDGWIEMLGRSGNINITLEHIGRNLEVSLAKSALLKALSPGLAPISEALVGDTPVALSHRFNIYPQELFKELLGDRKIIRQQPFELFKSLENWAENVVSPADEIVFTRTLTTLPEELSVLEIDPPHTTREKKDYPI